MIAFAGDPAEGNCAADANDLWVLSGANGIGTAIWTQLNPTGRLPKPRDGHSAVYDATTNRMIIFGGDDACYPLFNDVWVVSNADGSGGTPAWKKLAISGTQPAPRKAHTAVYDPNSNRMIVFGGGSMSGAMSDIWVLKHANGLGGSPAWLQLSPAAGPSPRFGHNAVYVAATNSMYIFGGTGTGGPFNDAWVLSHANGIGGIAAWRQVMPAGGPPAPREYATGVFDSGHRHRMTIFSGGDSPPFNNDVWVLTGVH